MRADIEATALSSFASQDVEFLAVRRRSLLRRRVPALWKNSYVPMKQLLGPTLKLLVRRRVPRTLMLVVLLEFAVGPTLKASVRHRGSCPHAKFRSNLKTASGPTLKLLVRRRVPVYALALLFCWNLLLADVEASFAPSAAALLLKSKMIMKQHVWF